MAGNYITNNEPYVFRHSAGDIRSSSKFVGGTVAWNQLIPFVDGMSWTWNDISFSFAGGRISGSGTAGRGASGAIFPNSVYKNIKPIYDHVYYLHFDGDYTFSSVGFYIYGATTQVVSLNSKSPKIFRCTVNDSTDAEAVASANADTSYTADFGMYLVDLTQMFGSTIADYIYSLEQATAGSGIAKLKEWGFFTKSYYPYDAGTLKSVEGVSAHVTTGFNQWDEEWEVGYINTSTGANTNANDALRAKNLIPCINAEYYVSSPYTTASNKIRLYFYDSNESFVSVTPLEEAHSGNDYGHGLFTPPASAKYFRFAVANLQTQTYNHDICVNLSDASRNGEYEPYSKHSYPLDSTLTLRGIPKLDSSNHLYYDGDTYESDGTVTRRYGIVDLGTLTWKTWTFSGSTVTHFYTQPATQIPKSVGVLSPMVCSKYIMGSGTYTAEGFLDKTMIGNPSNAEIRIRDDSFNGDSSAFKTAMSGVYLVYELATPTTETARPFSSSQVVNKYGTEEFAYDEDVLPVPVGHETTYLSKEDKSEKGEYLNAAGLSYFWEKVKSFFAKRIGFPEAPYKEVEWVESNGKQFVYLDWHPPIATWGFEADFLIKNAFNTTQAAWNASTNASNAGFLFGTQNSSTVNDIQLGTYSKYGFFRLGNGTNQFSTSGRMKTDKSRQTIKLIGTTLTGANGTAVTVSRASETSGKPYANMVLFCYHSGLRRTTSSGILTYPSTSRIYSLKFYEGTTVVVNLVGAIRKSDGVTGLYDKIAGHFYPAPGMTYGNDVGDLGSTETVLETAKNTIVQATANNLTHRRMWTVNVPTLSKLVDGQKLSITPMYTVVASVESDLATTEDSGNNTYVYLKLTLAGGNTTDWIPCYYMGATRLTSHYGSGHPIIFTYHENVFYGATDTAAGSAIMCGMFADPNYNTDRYYDVYSDTVIAGANGIKRYTLCMQDSTGKWTSIVNEANNANATGKTCYTGGLRLGKVLYHSAGAEYASGANAGTMWQTYAFDARYSMNGIANAASTTLEMRKPFYLVGTLHSNGLFYLDTTKWWAQDEPTSDDGKVYLLVGWAYSSYYGVYLAAHNPAYVFKNGKLQELTNTHVVDVDVPANAVFTDTVTTATTSGNGNAVTAITASNGALTVTKGTTFLTSHQDISGKADKSATVSTVTWDSTNKKLTKTINGSTTDVVTAATLRTGLNVADGAEVNQNAFSNVKVGSTTVAADSKTDTLELVAGDGISLTPDATNDKVTIAGALATGSKPGMLSSSDFTKLSGIATGAEVNQNAFSNVKVGSTTVAADAKTDTLELAAGTNITLTPDATNDKVTIAATDTKYSAGTGLSLSGTTFSNSGVTGVKGSAESSYRTGNVNLTADNVDAIKKNADGNTLQLVRSKYKNRAGDNTLDGKIRSLRANRLAFLPANQIIIEKTTDGGTTWIDAGIADSVKESLFAETRPATVAIPLLNGVKNIKCGLRVTFTAMKYNVPAGTSETQKYNYWNSQYINSTERYCELKEMYFFVYSNSDTISVKLERAKGDINNHGWVTSFDQPSWGMDGWSGSDYIRFVQTNFGGGTNQTSNWWNYRLTFMTRGVNGTETMATTYTTSAQTILEIRGYGDTYWNKGCEYAAEDKMYTHDHLKNVTFPAKVNATEFVGNLAAGKITGTLGVDHGGTGKTTAKDAANAFMNALDTGASTPADGDYYISQYVNGGTTTTTYHRRPMSALWAYIQSKISSVLGLTSSAYGGTSAKATADASGNTITSTYLTKAAGITDISWDSDSGMLKKTKNGSVSIVTPLSTAALTGSYDDLSDKPTISTLGGIPTSQKAAANGVASLGSDGKVPGAQLPDNANLSAVEARVTALEGLLNVVESWSPSSGYSIASSSSWSAALGSKAFQLAKGTYIVMFGADFSSNASGYRMVQINTSAAGNRYTPSSPPVNGNNTRLMGTVLLQPTATTNYYMYVFQNSGATLTVTPWARIIKIG